MTNPSTLHERLASDLLDDVLANPNAAAVLAQWRRRFKENDYDPAYVARIGQMQRDPAYWPLEQLAAFLQVHAGLMAGRYAYVEVSVGATPGPDADRVGNARKLEGVHEKFTAWLDMQQNGADSDGTLSWTDLISLNKSSGLGLITDCGTAPVEMSLHVDDYQVPLEVGFTKPSRTVLHLIEDGGVAHWAYGDDRILLLLDAERAEWWARGREPQAA